MRCLNCHKTGMWRKTQEREKINGYWVRVWQCRCGTKQPNPPPVDIKVKPKELVFDIETALMTVSTFSLYVQHQYLSSDAIIQNSFVICWSACWVDVGTPFQYVMSECVRPDEALQNNDRRILTGLWNLLDAADYVIGHNSDKFDTKKVNYRFFMHGMDAPYKSEQRDTLKIARKYFGAESHKLDDWIKRRGGDGKKHMSHHDWERIRATGDPESLLKMEMYNRHDVREDALLYLDFKRWIESSGRQVVK